MNVLDKFINSVAPVHGLKRMAARKTIEALNSGYGDGGASHSKRSLRGFTAKSLTPELDIDANLRTLVSRSRSLYMTAPIATSIIKTTKTNVIGSGLKLKANIDYEFLGLTEEQGEAWEMQIEREFALWAESNECDSMRLNNFYEMQSLFFMGQLLNGDAFCLRKYERPTKRMPYGLRLQLIESDRVCTPYTSFTSSHTGTFALWGVNENNGNEIFNGIEINKNGAVVAYWICNQYPYAMTGYDFKPAEWTRIETVGRRTGLRNILHAFEPERAEQRRGVPMLAPVIETLKQLTRYTDAELTAAVISGMFTVFIKTDSPTSEMPIGEGMPDGVEQVEHGENDYQLGNGTINVLDTNESIQIADPKRPNTAFDGFVDALAKQIGAAVEIPQQLLLKEFNASYSASRAALLEAWKKFRAQRELISKAFCQPVYEMFLTEAVASGRIKAPKFFDDPIIRKAWCSANWNGAAAGMIDPTKEVAAAKARIEEGLSTREEETMGLTGGDFARNVRQLKRENEMLKDAKEPLNPPTPVTSSGFKQNEEQGKEGEDEKGKNPKQPKPDKNE